MGKNVDSRFMMSFSNAGGQLCPLNACLFLERRIKHDDFLSFIYR